MGTYGLKEALADQDFIAKLNEVETKDDLQKLFDEKRIDITTDNLKEYISQVESKSSGEMDIDELESVTGGVNISGAAEAFGKMLFSPEVEVGLVERSFYWDKFKRCLKE